jgi:hypothetical protein
MKKKVLIALFVLITGLSANAQIFNNGQALRPEAISLGIEPVVLNNDFMLFLHGGIGLSSGVDFGVKAGFLGGTNYFGADIEFAIGNWVSIGGGAHSFGSFGLDGTLLATLPIGNGARISSGLDMDINFPGNDADFLLWLPIIAEIGLRQGLVFILEAEVALTAPAYHLFGGGLCFYF